MEKPANASGEAAAKQGKPAWLKPTLEVISIKEAMSDAGHNFVDASFALS
jgi:hypothetical protein